MLDPVTTVANQRAFFLTGTTLDVQWRKKQLIALRDAMIQYEKPLLDALRQDLGKAIFEGYETEFGLVYSEIEFMIKHLDKWAKPKKVPTSIINFPSSSKVHYEPLGVTLIMSPWNYPLQLTLAPLVSAIGAGNTAIIKPSRFCAATAQAMQTMLEATFPPEFVAVFQGGHDVNTTLLEQRFDFIFFTGSTNVGKVVMQAASQYITPVILELGGKSPTIVDETADIKLAATRIIWGKFLNAGQTCVAPDYVLVEKSKEQELLSEMKRAIVQFYGSDQLHNDEYPKIINDKHYQRLCALLSDGDIYFGGQQISQLQKIAPTIMTNVKLDSELMNDEIFGPILPVIPYESFDQVVSMIRSKEHPLALYLFSTNKERQQWVVKNIAYGGGCINDVVVHLSNPHLPFGGVGFSGMGRYHGHFGFITFSHQKGVLKKGNWLDIKIRYAPYKNKLGIVKKLMK